MDTKKEILSYFNLNSKRLPMSTMDLSNEFNLSRSVMSHYLNNLNKQGLIKKIDGRPVLWDIKNSERSKEYSFDDFIGSNGSLKSVVSQCKAAVNYPPNGLSIVITGNSGVGKSFLAREVYKYAISNNIISTKAPFVTLNCADYANNPELLSSILFGYVRGAFTGANEDKPGLLEQANGGYLFLDEVHRLSSENQEKLFSFIDNGKFRRVGENKHSRTSKARLLFATTEKVNDVLLETFRRRISIAVELPDYKDRPVNERLNMIYSIFYRESKRIDKKIRIKNEFLDKLMKFNSKGNIGQLKNEIKVSCATAYNNQIKSETITIGSLHSANNNVKDSIIIDSTEKLDFDNNQRYLPYSQKIEQMIISLNKSDSNTFQKDCYLAKESIKSQSEIELDLLEQPLYGSIKSSVEKIIVNQFGIKLDFDVSRILYRLYAADSFIKNTELQPLIKKIASAFPRTNHVAEYYLKNSNCILNIKDEYFEIILTLLLIGNIDESIKMRALLLAHGDYTATSIQSVVNRLCGEYILDAIDMPINTGIKEIVSQTKDMFDTYDTSKGIVMVVDMGSLNQIYSEIKNHINGHLLVVDNLTTATALDIALKIQSKSKFKQIAIDAENEYRIHSKYYSGYSNKKNVIISCISGLGISEKIKEIMLPYFPNNIQINTIDYYDLKNKIHQNDEHYFDTTLLILTTTSLPGSLKIPKINIYNLLDEKGEKKFSKILSAYLNDEAIGKVNQELIRFFSIEGVSERLSFLNPKVIIKEVEDVIDKYESYYHAKWDGKIKLNFYMHISLMIERLIIGRSEVAPEVEINKEEKKFIEVSKKIFQPLENKYNVTVNTYELSLMYEVFKTINE